MACAPVCPSREKSNYYPLCEVESSDTAKCRRYSIFNWRDFRRAFLFILWDL